MELSDLSICCHLLAFNETQILTNDLSARDSFLALFVCTYRLVLCDTLKNGNSMKGAQCSR